MKFKKQKKQDILFFNLYKILMVGSEKNNECTGRKDFYQNISNEDKENSLIHKNVLKH